MVVAGKNVKPSQIAPWMALVVTMVIAITGYAMMFGRMQGGFDAMLRSQERQERRIDRVEDRLGSLERSLVERR